MLTLALMGDVMLGRGVNEALGSMRPIEVWGDVLPHLAQADLRIANLECALTTHPHQWSRTWKMLHFRADPSAVKTLQAAHIDACSLANNHTLDYGERGLIDTLHTLKAAGIPYAGAGANDSEAAQPAPIEVPGVNPCRVALIAFTDNEPDFAAQPGRPGTNFMEVSLDQDTLARVSSAILQARAEGANLVVFSNHWGGNFIERPSPLFRDFARRVIELGADIYYGHSAHICQGIELHHGKPILYDTGNFIDDYAVDPVLRNDRSCLFQISFEGGSLQRIELVPVTLSFARVNIACEEEFDAICVRMIKLCGELGTPLARHSDRLVWQRS
jgi:poly-gamma-glutamate capsule biosynthesis protein CapA/YwtB (metallophosphatase superfamily)